MTLIELREDVLRGTLDVQARLADKSNDHLPNIEAIRARCAEGVKVAREKLIAAQNGVYVA